MGLRDDIRLKMLLPIEELESGAIDQIKDALSWDYIKKLAIMPDAHQGYEIPVGAVALLDGVISASAVGSDVGCGMCFYNTGLKASKLTAKNRQFIYRSIYDRVPVGFARNSEVPQELLDEAEKILLNHYEIDETAPDMIWPSNFRA